MDSMELLFFDTFSHDISEEINLDLVQFPKPVFISEVRIIPLGARVQADFPGGVRLGATNPSQFEIEFFVNDLSKPGASAFESLGGLEYKQNVHIQLECDAKHLPTDGLVLRGWYTTITLAVYGTLTKSLNNPLVITPAPPPAPVAVLQEDLSAGSVLTPVLEKDWYHDDRAHTNPVVDVCPAAAPSPPVHSIPASEPDVSSSAVSPELVQPWKKEDSPICPKSMKKPSTPPPESLVSLSPESISAEEEDGEPVEEECAVAEPFEPILSDEDIMADEAPVSLDNECDTLVDELYSDSPPDLLDIESHRAKFSVKLSDAAVEKLRDTITTVSKSVSNFNCLSGQEKETFVHCCENLCSLIQDFDVTEQDFLNLSHILDAGLCFEFACSQPQPAYKVRHVKVGVRFAEALCRLSVAGPEILLKTCAPYKLLSLCMRENFALPVKLAAVRAVDSALVDPLIVQCFLETENELYKMCLMMLDTAKLARLKYALSSLLRKIHVFESLSELKELTELEVQELMNAYTYSTTLMAQPKRQLPASAQMEFDKEICRNPRKHLIAYFKHWKLASRLLIVLCSPDSDSSLILVCRKFISLISDSKEGLLYLLEESLITKSLLKVLMYDKPGIGSSLAWKLQVIQRLLEIVKDPTDWAALRKLHSYLVYPEGLQAAVNVVSMDYFIECIVSCLSCKDMCEFAAVLIASVIRYSDKVQIFQHRASDLLEKSRNHSALREVTPYLNVLSTGACWCYGDVDALVGIIKKNAENAPSFPGELVTACRMLHYLVFPSDDDVDPMEPYIELKYKNALTQVFAADGLTAILSVMTNIFQFYELPLLHYNCLTGLRRLSLISLVSPCIKLTKAIVERLVKCMGTGFKNLTAVVPLLGVYCILEAIPVTNSTLFLTNEIIEALLLYTQAVDSDGSGNVAKSLWTQMLGEVLKMITSNPCCFVPGLKLLSRLLPPVLTSRETFSADKTRAIGFRKLWSAHLQAQATSLTDTLRLLCASWCTDVLTLVSVVCKQLSDLAAPTALLVGRCLLDGILAANPLESNLPILALLCDLMKHPPMKATVLTLTSPASRAQVKSDQKYPPVVEKMCLALKNTDDFKVQGVIIDIFETLCDHELGLIQGGQESFEKQLSHSVPSKEPLLSVVGTLIEILANAAKYAVATIEKVLKILVVLTAHNYGFYHVKSCLENKPDALKSFLVYLVSDLEKNQALTKKILVLLEYLTSCKAPERTLYLRVSQLSLLISWDKCNHPLEKIPEAADIVEILLISEDKEEKEPIPEMLEPLLQTPEALLNQFALRSVSSLDIVKNSDFKRFVFSIQNESSIDLLALAAESLPSDFNLLTETQRICSKIPLHYTTHFQVQNVNHDNNRQPQKQITTPAVKIKQPFVSPMRGRNQFSNSMRGASSGGGVGRGADPFRSRPPNTSRPPSLHVDDFVALETCGAQPTGPTGYNKLSIRGTNPPRGVLSGSRSRPWVPEGRPYLR